ncbi:hypothetical protein [Halobacterium zhouii]|uniref:hypothetical protein n=1 Tax=Halobacterium zhouii TaxID=2902624 RepID=UPI001E2F1E7E|nr:hypothetical protein [Halobacterium zhouii]
MPSRRVLAVVLAVAVVAVGGYVAYGELTGDDGSQTYDPPANLTSPDGIDIHEESFDRAKAFAVETEGDVVGAPATGNATASFYICEDAFCFDVEYPTADGTSRAFYHVTEQRAVRIPHDAAVREEPPERPVQRLLLVNAADSARGVRMQVIENADSARRQDGSVSETLGAYEAEMVTIDDLEANTTYQVIYRWEADDGSQRSQSLTFEAGNHSDAVWVFE